MGFKINGTAILIQPIEHGWEPRRVLGLDGNNKAIYTPTYSYKFGWDAMLPDEFKQLRDFWSAVAASGAVSVDLPQIDAATYVFATYTNCVIDEPTYERYYQGYRMQVSWMVRNIVP